MSVIKDLPPELKELALRRQEELMGIRNEDYSVAGAFSWTESPEGNDFWRDVTCGIDVSHYECYPRFTSSNYEIY
jgi:hypothetical protein